MKQISFKTTKEETKIIRQIVDRAMKIAKKMKLNYPAMDCDMDISACHASGNPLRLSDLLNADDFNFSHDVFGIRRHINRQTGELENCFSPRFSAHELAVE